jgi:hypothetical protein
VAPALKSRVVPLALVLGSAVGYPLIASGGAPRFPHRGECVHPARGEGPVDAVFARFRVRGRAAAALQRARSVGFQGLDLESDGCGYVRVVLDDVPSLAVGRDLVAEAARVGFHVTLERPAQ